MTLTVATIEVAKAGEKDRRLLDTDGLFLLLARVAEMVVLQIPPSGKEKQLSLATYLDMTPAKASRRPAALAVVSRIAASSPCRQLMVATDVFRSLRASTTSSLASARLSVDSCLTVSTCSGGRGVDHRHSALKALSLASVQPPLTSAHRPRPLPVTPTGSPPTVAQDLSNPNCRQHMLRQDCLNAAYLLLNQLLCL